MGGNSSSLGDECLGYRVLGVQDNSPASKAGLVSFFDFIIAANGVNFDQGPQDVFVAILNENVGRTVCLTVYNIKAGNTRGVALTPSNEWPGQGLLGVTISWDSYFQAEEHVLRVLEVQPGSPADKAGLKILEDFLLGTTKVDFKDSEILSHELQRHMGRAMEVYVFNSQTDSVRRIHIKPQIDWGGAGCFGASVGSGYLHRLPESCRGTLGESYDHGPPDGALAGTAAAERDADYTDSFLETLRENHAQVTAELRETEARNCLLRAQLHQVEEDLDEAAYHLEMLHELAHKIPQLEAELKPFRRANTSPTASLRPSSSKVAAK